MSSRPVAWCCLAVLAAIVGCSPGHEEHAAPGTPGERPHGDHYPRHGGIVFMDRDLHFEVVARPAGEYRVYFTDELRHEMPPSAVEDVTIEILRPQGDSETVTLEIDDSDGSWRGDGRAVEDGETTVRISYTYQGQPYWIDVPFWTFERAASASGMIQPIRLRASTDT
jgi:hypothetical protein